MKQRPDKPNIFAYRSPSVYLADLILWYKSKGVSLRTLAEKLNISPALVSLMSKGKRSITEENVDIFATIFEWSSAEVSFLKNLLLLSSRHEDERQDGMKGLVRFKTYQEKSSDEVLTYKYLEHWWNLAIRELSELEDFKEEEVWIQQRLLFSVSLADIRKSLNFLNKHKLLAKYGSFRRVDCKGEVYKLSLSSFHKQILEKAVESIYLLPSAERHILGHTLLLRKEQMEDLKIILDETLEKITRLSSEGKGKKEVFHVALAGFPLTLDKEEK